MFDLVCFLVQWPIVLLPFRWEYSVVSFHLLSTETSPLLHLGVNCIYFLFSEQTFQFVSKHTVSSMSMASLWGQFIMTMSGIWVVAQMSVSTVEIPHLLLWPGRSKWMIQSVALFRLCARVNMWLSALLCLQVYLPSFNIVGQLLRLCSSVSSCEHNSHLELDLFHHLIRLLFVGRVSRTELSKNFTVFLGKFNM